MVGFLTEQGKRRGIAFPILPARSVGKGTSRRPMKEKIARPAKFPLHHPFRYGPLASRDGKDEPPQTTRLRHPSDPEGGVRQRSDLVRLIRTLSTEMPAFAGMTEWGPSASDYLRTKTEGETGHL